MSRIGWGVFGMILDRMNDFYDEHCPYDNGSAPQVPPAGGPPTSSDDGWPTEGQVFEVRVVNGGPMRVLVVCASTQNCRVAPVGVRAPMFLVPTPYLRRRCPLAPTPSDTVFVPQKAGRYIWHGRRVVVTCVGPARSRVLFEDGGPSLLAPNYQLLEPGNR